MYNNFLSYISKYKLLMEIMSENKNYCSSEKILFLHFLLTRNVNSIILIVFDSRLWNSWKMKITFMFYASFNLL